MATQLLAGSQNKLRLDGNLTIQAVIWAKVQVDNLMEYQLLF